MIRAIDTFVYWFIAIVAFVGQLVGTVGLLATSLYGLYQLQEYLTEDNA